MPCAMAPLEMAPPRPPQRSFPFNLAYYSFLPSFFGGHWPRLTWIFFGVSIQSRNVSCNPKVDVLVTIDIYIVLRIFSPTRLWFRGYGDHHG